MVAAFATLALAACGGGGDDAGAGAGATTPSIGGINGGGIARGAITGFGSIFVNGVEFSTSGATIRVEDATAAESQLKLGQIVTVQGTISDDGRTGTARTVAFNDDVEGPVQSINLAASSFVVLGQTVRVTATTVFDGGIAPAALSGVTVGTIVEVSGLPDSNGVIVATRVERKAAAGELEVSGRVAALDAAQRRFAVNALTVDYATATVTNGTLANGACVEAKGTNVAGSVLTATRVEVKSCALGAAAGDRGEVEGLITRFVSATDFDVGGQRVTTTATTTYVNGAVNATAADLRLDLRVEVEGTFNAAGVLEARKVEIKPDSSSRLQGTVDSINAASSSFNVFGIAITVNANTRLEDKSAARVSPFRLADLRTADYVEVRGFRGTAAASIVATLVERNTLDSRRELQGQVTAVARPNLTILGVGIATSAGTQFRNVDDAALTADAFFAAAANRVVKVRGTWNGTTFAATEAELEN
jgi:hypothetical protein